MMTLGFALIITMVAAELYVNKEWPKLGHWIRANSKRSLVFSLALSFAITMLFPAAGMLVMLAAIASTVIMQPIYRMLDFKDRHMAIWRYRHAVVKHKLAMIVWRINVWQHRYNMVRHPIHAVRARFSK